MAKKILYYSNGLATAAVPPEISPAISSRPFGEIWPRKCDPQFLNAIQKWDEFGYPAFFDKPEEWTGATYIDREDVRVQQQFNSNFSATDFTPALDEDLQFNRSLLQTFKRAKVIRYHPAGNVGSGAPSTQQIINEEFIRASIMFGRVAGNWAGLYAVSPGIYTTAEDYATGLSYHWERVLTQFNNGIKSLPAALRPLNIPTVSLAWFPSLTVYGMTDPQATDYLTKVMTFSDGIVIWLPSPNAVQEARVFALAVAVAATFE